MVENDLRHKLNAILCDLRRSNEERALNYPFFGFVENPTLVDTHKKTVQNNRYMCCNVLRLCYA